MKIYEGGKKVDLPRLSAAINAIEYSKYTLTQMKKFIMEFKEEANLQKIAPKVVEYKEELSQYLKEIKIIKRKNEWVKMIDMTEILQKFMKIIQDSEEMKQISITKSVFEFQKANNGENLQNDQGYVNKIKVRKMIAQRLEDIKIQDAQVIDEKKEEYEQTLDEVIKKNELLSEVIEIIEIEIEDKTNQLEETTQKLIDRDNFIIELQSQVETLTEEIKNKGELIQNSDPDKISENPTLRELIKFYNQQLGRSSSNSANFELSLYLNE
eukprot:CAMPEP_0205803866 /NCGR_PEP_ID=MMETSP0205-20121125/6612_1 /ASSEMBLY_ACC=CAM_ASM_000278 /TAXON_ID=36767 /ORGANISM="Euplotes focardii, Strain TN1" /LENGTH=267 /DNA_ID=CAMNT_0053072557 /DNA_START=151 /DNA_END=954 /DNA_ORIENTATION=+